MSPMKCLEVVANQWQNRSVVGDGGGVARSGERRRRRDKKVVPMAPFRVFRPMVVVSRLHFGVDG